MSPLPERQDADPQREHPVPARGPAVELRQIMLDERERRSRWARVMAILGLPEPPPEERKAA